MATVNERLADEAIRHAVYFDRYTRGVVNRLIALLNRVDANLAAELQRALQDVTPSDFRIDRLESLMTSVRQINAQLYSQIGMELTAEIRRAVEYELGYQLELFDDVLPAQIKPMFSAITVEQAYAAAMARPFQGRLLRDVLTEMGEDKARRVRRAIAEGYAQGKTTPEIVRSIRGTRALQYRDGIIEMDRRHVETITITALHSTAATARDQLYEANADLIKAVVWTSTIDLLTTPECRIRDGKRYTLDRKPVGHSIPWGAGPARLHMRCRSVSVPVTKSWRELGVDIDEFEPATRASMDGQIPAETTYPQWLAKQSAARQDDVLGPTRGKLLREGGLKVEEMYGNRGQWLTLDQLRARDAEAFRKAGV